MEMLDLGIFEGIYTAAIQNIPGKYKKHEKVLKRGADPDPSINRFGVKSRQSLKEWQKKGWTTELSPLGWWEWYVKYWNGRRDEKEDKLQIGRWKSFVARHQGQVSAKCKPKDHECHAKQRQGLLQWAWNSDTPFTDQQRKSNLTRLQKHSEVSMETTHAHPYLKW
jgi:hypothetical protein